MDSRFRVETPDLITAPDPTIAVRNPRLEIIASRNQVDERVATEGHPYKKRAVNGCFCRGGPPWPPADHSSGC